MRIGTWNMQGRWDSRHQELLQSHNCDVWLLTEVSDRVELPGCVMRRTSAQMAPRRRWAAVASREPSEALPDPHPATAAARIDGVTYWSTILPWRSSGGESPWRGATHAERTSSALDDLLVHRPSEPLVWGGDFNHGLTGPECAGSKAGRTAVDAALQTLGLTAHTTLLPHVNAELRTIDHIATQVSWQLLSVSHVTAEHDGARLSDHDLYTAEVRTRAE